MKAKAAPPAAPARTLTLMRFSCGICAAGRHDLCPGAVFNPGSGLVKTPAAGGNPATYHGELMGCPCPSAEHDGAKPVLCRDCGARNPLDACTDRGTCTDVEGCLGRAAARREANPVHRMVQECLTTTVVSGEVIQRPRRATQEQVAQRRTERAAAVARPCTCNCGGTTKGGAFLPGHDARFVSNLVVGVTAKNASGLTQLGGPEARALLAPFPALLAKFNKRLGAS